MQTKKKFRAEFFCRRQKGIVAIFEAESVSMLQFRKNVLRRFRRLGYKCDADCELTVFAV